MQVQMVERTEMEYTRNISADYNNFKTGGFSISIKAKGCCYDIFYYFYRWSDCTVPPFEVAIDAQRHTIESISFYICDHGMIQKTRFGHPLTLCDQEVLFVDKELIRDEDEYPVYQDVPGDFDFIRDRDDFYVVEHNHHGELFGYPSGINGRDRNYILMDRSNNFKGILMK
ncbi:MAG: hypothetical protein PHE53_02595 [Thermoguttaceae bacterium]|nr:hypothetical protein [Thermoguttaceae bacterium]